jgi:superfamily II DNA or RNA helicase
MSNSITTSFIKPVIRVRKGARMRKLGLTSKTSLPTPATPPTDSSANQPFQLTDEYKASVCSQSYLGKKGYTIPKTALSKEDETCIRDELFVKPFVKCNYGMPNATNEVAFPVYRESNQKIYIPRFYGINRYGLPTKSEISPGETISVEFTKTLRDYQNSIIDIYMKHIETAPADKGNGAILEVPCGFGKTVMALKIISLLRRKTLILVHKEFLMNQWIERISEFLPNAKVGHIQGQIMDIQNKDIVIGMIQSLYDRTFESTFFDQFGFTIIDEVHRIGSEQFSKTLLKTITPYMLGISATVERKDKLTKVLNMFIGDKIYSKKRDDDDLVSVRAIEYNVNNFEFNEVETDFRGNPKYSTMISKLCEFGPRSDFIVKVIGDLVLENEENQIMILAHNRNLLTYLHDSILHKKIASVGYYVGGMKQTDLLATESKQIVLATYAMAAEALDIKSLSTLVMVTPKTDIIQSVGRILRVKHENPIVVDIVDKHDIFQNQWKQRLRFYKQCNYRIRYVNSNKYTNMKLDWETETLWRRVFDPKNTNRNTDSVNNNNEEENEIPVKKCLIDINLFD